MKRAVQLGLMSFGVAAIVLGVGYFLLGMVTGVISMCPSAPHWWFSTYLYAVPVLFLAVCVWIGLRVHANVSARGSTGPDER